MAKSLIEIVGNCQFFVAFKKAFENLSGPPYPPVVDLASPRKIPEMPININWDLVLLWFSRCANWFRYTTSEAKKLIPNSIMFYLMGWILEFYMDFWFASPNENFNWAYGPTYRFTNARWGSPLIIFKLMQFSCYFSIDINLVKN